MKKCFFLKLVSLLAALPMALTSCTPKEIQAILQPSQALGAVLADETAQIAGAKKRVAIITPDANWGATSIAEKAFTAALKKQGFTIVETRTVNVGDPMKSGPIGLKSSDLLEVLKKFPDVGAVVSFAGGPIWLPAEAVNFPAEHPPVLVVAAAMLGEVPGIPTDKFKLAQMLDAKVIQLAIIDGTESAGQNGGKASPDREQFAQHYQTMRLPSQ
jgi:hypothetical protein